MEITLVQPPAAASLVMRPAATIETLSSALAAPLPSGPAWSRQDEDVLIGAGPVQWLVISSDENLIGRIAGNVGQLASIADQTDARVWLRLAGAQARQALAKLVTIDLHPRTFRAGSAATTICSHMTVLLRQLDEGPTYELAFARSMAASGWSAVSAAAAEFGMQVEESIWSAG